MVSSPQLPTNENQITIKPLTGKNNRAWGIFRTFSPTLERIDSLSNTVIEAHAEINSEALYPLGKWIECMGGHSHWSTIKRHKGAQDAKRGKIFTRVIREISIAARSGGDPDGNPALRQAIAKSKEVNMPADTVKRAIQRGTGELPGMQFEEFMLEGYGPGGTALLLEISTDKRNRTVAEVRNILTKNNGTMAEAGAVAWQFHKKGLLVIEGQPVTEEQLFDLVLEAGAEDVKQTPTGFEVISEPTDFEAVKEAVQKAQIETSLSELTFLPQNHIQLEGKDAEQALKLMDLLDENEDVAKVHANFEISDELMEKMAAESA